MGRWPIRTVEERLLAKVEQSENGCWEWKACKIPQGYGYMNLGGKARRAHRISYELFVGPIPDGMDVLHDCDNTSCINPAHLFLGTDFDNQADMRAKGRGVYMPGEANGSAKLTEEQVIIIRKSSLPQRTIARMLGVSKTQVGRIRRGESWRYNYTV